jgi:predicted XRE-type DNA-binding protein
LSKVADGKRTTGYADEDFIAGAIWQQQRSYTEEENCLQEATSEKLDTTNTLWSDLADRCFEEFKKSKLKTTIHYLVVGSVGK